MASKASACFPEPSPCLIVSLRPSCSGRPVAQAWSSGAGAASPLLTVAVLAKLPPPDAALVPALAGALLLQHADALRADATAAAAWAAVASCLHWSRDVRRAGRAALARCVTSAPTSTSVSPQHRHTAGCMSNPSLLHVCPGLALPVVPMILIVVLCAAMRRSIC